MKTKDWTSQEAIVLLSDLEVMTIANALNEVCHGLEVPEFQTRMGATLEDAQALHRQIGGLFDSMRGRTAGRRAR